MPTKSSIHPLFVPTEARPVIASEIQKAAGTRWTDKEIAKGILNPSFDYFVSRARRGEIGSVKAKEVPFLDKLLLFLGLSKDELLIR